MRNFATPHFPNTWREDQAEQERADGIPDREPITDVRDCIEIDLRSHGGKLWRIKPRLGYTSCGLIDVEADRVVMRGTLKQLFRFLSRQQPHRLGYRNLQ